MQWLPAGVDKHLALCEGRFQIFSFTALPLVSDSWEKREDYFQATVTFCFCLYKAVIVHLYTWRWGSQFGFWSPSLTPHLSCVPPTSLPKAPIHRRPQCSALQREGLWLQDEGWREGVREQCSRKHFISFYSQLVEQLLNQICKLIIFYHAFSLILQH